MLAEIWPFMYSHDGVLPLEVCEKYRKKLIKLCDQWIKRKKPNRKVMLRRSE